MNSILFIFFTSQIIIIPTIIGAIKYNHIDESFHPFVWLCGCLTLNDIIKFVLIQNGITNGVSYNVFILIICMIYLILFYRWGVFQHKKYWLPVLMALMTIIWVADHFLIAGYRLTQFTIYFRTSFALLLVLLSVNIINQLVVSEKKSLWKNPKFIICATLVFYYTYRIIYNAFSLNGMSHSFLFLMSNLNRYFLIGFNLIFALAAIWIPRKKNFTLQL